MSPEKARLYRAALRGTEPEMGQVANLEARGLGRFIGGFADAWQWDLAATERLEGEKAADLYEFLTGEKP